MTSTFDSPGEHPLKMRRNVRDSARKNFALLVQITLQQFNVLIVNVLDVVKTGFFCHNLVW